MPALTPQYVIGIDAGGTKSQVVVWHTDDLRQDMEASAVLARARSNQRLLGINLDVIDVVRANERFLTVLEAAAQSVGLDVVSLLSQSHLIMGMAGLDSALDNDNAQAWLQSVWESLGAQPSIALIPDIELALWSAAGDGTGIVLIAGTGSNCFGRNAQGQTAKTSGMSHFLSDEGSGFMLGWEALHAAQQMADGRRPVTELLRAVLAAYGVESTAELKRSIVRHPDYKQEVARVAPVVQRLATEGDVVARAIVREQAETLVRMVATVQTSLGSAETMVYPVGGVFADEAYFASFVRGVEALGLRVTSGRVEHPVVGAVAYWHAQS